MPRQLTRRFGAGIVTFVPGLWRLAERATGGSNSARYCYEIWLRHLYFGGELGLDTNPKVVAEIGPGDSLGTGIAALLSGASTYVAFDAVEYAATDRDQEMVEVIRALFAEPAAVPITVGGMHVADDVSPRDVIGAARVKAAAADDRARDVRSALGGDGHNASGLRLVYSAGSGAKFEGDADADVLFSQAVMEHVDGLEHAYSQMHQALRPGGWMSHAIDFKSHDFARDWNGHWTFGEQTWKLIRGRRRFAINREPLATHLALIEAAGFEVVSVRRAQRVSTLSRSELASRFRGISDDDLTTASAVVQAVKREETEQEAADADKP
jgi:SAM-dependent methyltransferase